MSVEHLVNNWITTAYERGASDLHIEPHTKDRVRVRMRVDGQLRQLETADDVRKVLARIKVTAELSVNEKDRPLDGRINFGQRGGSIGHLDLRVSTTPCLGGEKVVMRLIDNRKLNLNLETLGFTGATIAGLIVAEGALLGLLGGGAGAVGAFALLSLQTYSVSMEGVHVEVSAGPSLLLSGLVASIVLSVLAGAVPALRVARGDLAGAFRT